MATDQDSGLDGIIRYAIEGDAMRYLTIDSDTGQLILKKELAEMCGLIFCFTISIFSNSLPNGKGESW